ncbi:hypothetical protein LUZ60_017780 [Juncus effusus]|nr:hypothetical protein LUZ60_017780 [Juncus effusus]
MANCSLADVNCFEEPLMITKEEILPRPPLGIKLEEQILLAQITEFNCGGFSVGICFNHMIFDGEGAAQFMKAVGEMASGLPEPTVNPVWSREAIAYPPIIPPGEPHLSFTTFDFDLLIIDVSLERINQNKELFFNQTGKKCTTFEIITAMIFISRAKAINLALNDKVSLHFAASARHLLYDMFPYMKGYYGNFGYGAGMMKTSEEICNASLVEATTLIRNAKEVFSTTFDRAPNMSLDYGMVFVSDWRRLEFNKVDYRWGEPKYVFTLNNQICVSGVVTYLNPPVPKQGIRLMLRCVKEEHKAKFLHEIQKF